MGLDKIIEIIINNSYITTLELTKLGYIDEDIRELINEGYLRKDGVGKYIIGDVSIVKEYASKMKNQGREDFAKKIEEYCDVVTSDSINPILKLLDKSIAKENKKDIFVYLDMLFSEKYAEKIDDNTKKDLNLYLLLISYLYDVDDKYKDILEDLNLEDILVGENQEDKVRKNLYFRSFYEAKVAFEKRISMSSEFSINDKLEKDLIRKTIEKYRKLKDVTLNLMDNKRFTKLRDVLYEESDKNFLNIKFEYLLKLVIDYIEISKNNVVPDIRKGNTTNTFEAIKLKDYKKALELMTKYKEEKNINYDDPLYIMLIKINELVNEINSIKEELSENTIKMIKEEKLDVKEEKPIEKKKEVKVEKKEEIKPIVKEEPVVKKKELVLETKDIKRIEKQVQEIYDGKLIVIVDKIDPVKSDLVVEEITKYREVTAFKIGSGKNAKVVLRSKPYIAEKYNIMDLVNEARTCLYTERNYKRAEELYRLLLQIGTPRDRTYGDYGLTLLKLHRRWEAIPYLKIATELSKEQGHSLDYSDLIITIDGTIKKSEAKPMFRMNENDFHEDKTFGLELDYLDDLVNLVLEDELDLEDAMNRLNLDEENKNIIRLICARDSYYLKDYNKGDKYYSKVLKSSNKSNNVKKIMEKVIRDKKYYKNRLKEEENQLVFRK